MKEILGGIATLVALAGYIPYFRDIFKGKTKPHIFSWLIWGILAGEGFVVQMVEGAGAGAWVTAAIFVAILFILVLSLWKGDRDIKVVDWVMLVAALFTFIPWYLTNNPTISIILIIIIDFFGFVPTIRKSYSNPYSETLLTYVSSGVTHVLALFAMNVYSIGTSLYPAYLVVINAVFVAMLAVRRSQEKMSNNK